VQLFDGHELLDAGITVKEFSRCKVTTKSQFVLESFRDAGVTAKELQECDFDEKYLLWAGYSFEELRQAGYSDDDLFDFFTSDAFAYQQCGYTVEEIMMKFRHDSTALRRVGFSPAFLEAFGFSLEDMVATALRRAGFSPAFFEAAGFSLEDMVEAGFSIRELREFFSFWLLPGLSECVEYPLLQSLLHEMGNRHGSVKRQVENLLLLDPCVRRRLLEQVTSTSVASKWRQLQECSATSKLHRRREYKLRKAEKRAHEMRRFLERRQFKKCSARGKVH